jgi:light-regulated signal transduction histidine kinase (bacteriophytochrome)
MLHDLSWSDFTQCLAGALVDEIAAHVVHEVNNPLAVISGTAEQLGKLLDASSQTQPVIERTSDIILRNTARIRATTRALQDLAQKANSTCYREARLGELLGAAASLCHAGRSLSDVRLELPDILDDAHIWCSPPAIVLVLAGMFECSARLAGKSGRTLVTVVVERAAKEYRITATSDCSPLSSETLTALSAVLSVEGALILDEWWALRIAKKIARSHKGNIAIIIEGNSAALSLTLPISQAEFRVRHECEEVEHPIDD